LAYAGHVLGPCEIDLQWNRSEREILFGQTVGHGGVRLRPGRRPGTPDTTRNVAGFFPRRSACAVRCHTETCRGMQSAALASQ